MLEQVLSPRAVPLAVAAMKAHPTNAHVQERGCAVLYTMSSLQQNKAHSAEAGSVEVVCEAMRRAQSLDCPVARRASVKRRACGFLAGMAAEPTSHAAILAQGAVDLVGATLKEYGANPEVAEAAIRAWHNLGHNPACRAAIQAADGAAEIRRVVDLHPADSDVQGLGVTSMHSLFQGTFPARDITLTF